MYDAIVVGGGPAGLSAATWLARHRRKVVLLDAGDYRNRWVERSHGYLALDNVDPAAIRDAGRSDLAAYPTAEIRATAATGVEGPPGGPFVVQTGEGPVQARRLVLATGVEDQFPDVDGFFDHYGASVFHCPTCDGYEAAEREVVAFGWSAEVAGFALNLLDWAARVTVITDGSRFEGDMVHRSAMERHGVDVLEDDAESLVGIRGDLQGVRLRGGRTIRCQLAFFSIAHHPRSGLARDLGCRLTEENCIVVDDHGETTVAGVYAAGDVTPGLHLVQVGAAKGAMAGVFCAQSLRGQPPAEGAPEPGPDVEDELSG